jgi:hypothetical protein
VCFSSYWAIASWMVPMVASFRSTIAHIKRRHR